jgi:hypothetical protein
VCYNLLLPQLQPSSKFLFSFLLFFCLSVYFCYRFHNLFVGDSPRGPLNNRGKPASSHKKIAKRELTYEPENAHTHNTITTLVAPVAH